jgi:hypothetical protein
MNSIFNVIVYYFYLLDVKIKSKLQRLHTHVVLHFQTHINFLDVKEKTWDSSFVERDIFLATMDIYLESIEVEMHLHTSQEQSVVLSTLQ